MNDSEDVKPQPIAPAASDAAEASSITGATDSPPVPLRQRTPSPAFPIEHLGPILSGAAAAIERKVQVPGAMAAQSVLAAAALAAQGHVDVELPTGDLVPVSLYFITSANSGDRKTRADSLAMRPVRIREAELRAAYIGDMQQHRNSKDTWDHSRQAAIRGAGGEIAAVQTALDSLPAEPFSPLQPILVVQEPTIEGLLRLLDEGHPSLGLFSDEGGQFIGGYSMADDMRMRTATILSKLWEGTPQTIVRKVNDPIISAGRRLSLHLMMQPHVTQRVLKDSILDGVGLMSRILVSAPDSLAGTRFWREPEQADSQALTVYEDAILALLRRPLPIKPGTKNELEPRILRLSDDARSSWIEFSDSNEREVGPDGSLVAIKPFAAKAAEHAARIAAVITVVGDPDATTITADTMEASIAILNYYLDEWLRLTAIHREDEALDLAEQALDWLQAKGFTTLRLRDLYSSGPNHLRSAKKARLAVRKLQDHGYLIPRTGETDSWDVRLK